MLGTRASTKRYPPQTQKNPWGYFKQCFLLLHSTDLPGHGTMRLDKECQSKLTLAFLWSCRCHLWIFKGCVAFSGIRVRKKKVFRYKIDDNFCLFVWKSWQKILMLGLQWKRKVVTSVNLELVLEMLTTLLYLRIVQFYIK